MELERSDYRFRLSHDLEGSLALRLPPRSKKVISKMVGRRYWLMFLIMAILGTYLTYCGFTNS